MNINIEFNGLDAVIKKLDSIAIKQVPFAVVNALNKTARMVQTVERMKMKRLLDRPTPHALKTLVIDLAKKKTNKYEASVFFTDDDTNLFGGTPGANFMQPQVEGGKRNLKRFEHALRYKNILPADMFVVPGIGCPLDAYGGIPVSVINQVISYFGARYKEGYNLETTDKKKKMLAKGSKRTGFGFEYFVSNGRGVNGQHLPPGIYKRVKFSSGSAIKPFFMFVKQPTYKKRFPFYEIAQKVVDERFAQYFNESLEAAIKTAK